MLSSTGDDRPRTPAPDDSAPLPELSATRRGSRIAGTAAIVMTLALAGFFASAIIAPLAGASVAAPAATSVHVTTVAPTATAQPRLAEIAAIARKAATQHIRYVYGAGHGRTPGSPRSGFDCSGFVRWVYAQVGWDIGAGSGESVRRSGKFVRTSHPVPGDLIFFGSSSAHHVAIYLSPGKMVDAPHVGANVGIHSIYRGVMGYYHPKAATGFDSRPLRTTTHATISVHSPAGKAVPGAAVTVYAGPGCAQRVRTLRTNSRGQTSVTQLSGRYCVAMTSPPAGYLAAPKRIVYLTAGKSNTWRIRAPYAQVPVAIHALNGRSELGGVTVAVYRSDCRTLVGTYKTASTRAISLRLAPANYCLKVRTAPRGWAAAAGATRVTVAPRSPVSVRFAFHRLG